MLLFNKDTNRDHYVLWQALYNLLVLVDDTENSLKLHTARLSLFLLLPRLEIIYSGSLNSFGQ